MKYAVLSDVHGNRQALAAVLDYLRTQNPDRYLFMGDAVGYGAAPNGVCDILRALDPVAVVGNHDAAVVGKMAYDEYYEAARLALDWCGEQITKENHAWLASLPYEAKDGDVGLCHGLPEDPEAFDYLLDAQQAVGLCDRFDALPKITFIGHSHLTLSFALRPDAADEIEGSSFALEEGVKYIVTVGSVGQPRDRDPRACCGILDMDAQTFSFKRLEYDIEAARQEIVDAGLPQVFGDRLRVGM